MRGLDGREIFEISPGQWVEAADGSPYPSDLVPGGGNWGTRGAPTKIPFEISDDRTGWDYDPAQGQVIKDGVSYVRAGALDPQQVRSIFGDQAIFDPYEGMLIPKAIAEQWFGQQSKDQGILDKYGPYIAMAAMGGIAAAGAGAGAGASAAAGGVGGAEAAAAGGGAGGLGLELGAGAGSAAFPTTAAEIAAANQAAAAAIGETVATGTSGALGAAGGGITFPSVSNILTSLGVPEAVAQGAGALSTASSFADLANSGGSDITNIPGLGDINLGTPDPGALTGGLQTVAQPATGLGAPFQLGFNLLDPSTYGATGAAGATSALKWLSEQTGLSEAALKAAGGLAKTGLGIYSGLQQSDATEDLGNRILNMGAPSLARYEASFQPGFDIFSQDAYKNALDSSWNSALRGLSTKGNPFGNPGGLIEANKAITGGLALPALQNYRETNRAAGFGNVPQYAQLQSNAIGQQGGAWEAAGAGLESILNPRRNYTLNLSDLLSLK